MVKFCASCNLYKQFVQVPTCTRLAVQVVTCFFFYLLFIFGIYMYKVTGNNNKSQILDECIEETVYKTHK